MYIAHYQKFGIYEVIHTDIMSRSRGIKVGDFYVATGATPMGDDGRSIGYYAKLAKGQYVGHPNVIEKMNVCSTVSARTHACLSVSEVCARPIGWVSVDSDGNIDGIRSCGKQAAVEAYVATVPRRPSAHELYMSADRCVGFSRGEIAAIGVATSRMTTTHTGDVAIHGNLVVNGDLTVHGSITAAGTVRAESRDNGVELVSTRRYQSTHAMSKVARLQKANLFVGSYCSVAAEDNVYKYPRIYKIIDLLEDNWDSFVRVQNEEGNHVIINFAKLKRISVGQKSQMLRQSPAIRLGYICGSTYIKDSRTNKIYKLVASERRPGQDLWKDEFKCVDVDGNYHVVSIACHSLSSAVAFHQQSPSPFQAAGHTGTDVFRVSGENNFVKLYRDDRSSNPFFMEVNRDGSSKYNGRIRVIRLGNLIKIDTCTDTTGLVGRQVTVTLAGHAITSCITDELSVSIPPKRDAVTPWRHMDFIPGAFVVIPEHHHLVRTTGEATIGYIVAEQGGRLVINCEESKYGNGTRGGNDGVQGFLTSSVNGMRLATAHEVKVYVNRQRYVGKSVLPEARVLVDMMAIAQ